MKEIMREHKKQIARIMICPFQRRDISIVNAPVVIYMTDTRKDLKLLHQFMKDNK